MENQWSEIKSEFQASASQKAVHWEGSPRGKMDRREILPDQVEARGAAPHLPMHILRKLACGSFTQASDSEEENVSPVRLSKRETAQWERKLAAQRSTSPLKRQGNGLGNPGGYSSPLSQPKRRGDTPMPSTSYRGRCQCGISFTFCWTDREFAEKFIAGWWRRHSGEGHSKIK